MRIKFMRTAIVAGTAAVAGLATGAPALAAPVNPRSGNRQILAGSLHAHHGTEFFRCRHQEFSLSGLDASGRPSRVASFFWTSMMISALRRSS